MNTQTQGLYPQISKHLNIMISAFIFSIILAGVIGYCLYPISHHKTTHYFELPEEVSQLQTGDTVMMVQTGDTTRMDMGKGNEGQVYLIK